MSNAAFLAFALTLGLSASAQQPVVLHPIKDAVIGVHPGYPTATNNYGTADHFSCTSQPGGQGGENNSRSLMAFDLSSFNTWTLVDSAFLDLHGRGPHGTGSSTTQGNNGANLSYLERITSPWTEMGVTWNTQPTTSPINAVALAQSTSATQDYLHIDVTDMTQDMISDPDNGHGISIRLAIEDVTRGLYFCSRDFLNPAKHPVLRIFVNSEVSVDDLAQYIGTLKVLPSLTTNEQDVRIELPEALENAVLRVFNSAGILVQEQGSGRMTSTVVATSGLTPGVYHVAVMGNANAAMIRASFVIQ